MRTLENIKSILVGFLVLLLLTTNGCKKEDVVTILKIEPEGINFQPEGGLIGMEIITDAESWSIVNQSDWINLSTSSGTQTTALVTVSVTTVTPEFRSDTLVISAGNATPVKVFVTQEGTEFIYSLSATAEDMSFSRTGSEERIKISTTAPDWEISDDVDWISYDNETGESGESYVTITASKYEGTEARSGTITINAQYAPTVEITVGQRGAYYPDYNTNPQDPDATGMSHTAMEIASEINLGWNMGNSLEAIGGETAWGNPLVSPELIDLVKENGFNAVRIPCSFNQYMSNSETAEIDVEWLERVKTVIGYITERDMYAILNIHWDGGWLENNVTPDMEEANNAKQKAFWQQIATYLRDFDEHLMFASTNEPNVETESQMEVLNTYHQTFIDAVRSTGGRNAYRVIVLQGPSTDIAMTHNLWTELPVDNVPNKMMAEIHYYTPWNFCGLTENASWGNMFYYWGEGYHSATDPEHNATWGEESDADYLFSLLKSQFYNKGIPVILGEYAGVRRSALTGEDLELHLASRAYYFYYVTKVAKANGVIPFYWDNGYTDNNGCAIFDRTNNSVFDQQALDAIIEGGNE